MRFPGLGLLFLGILFSFTHQAQQMPVVYGQNRVQYKSFDFSHYTSDHFHTYFYVGEQDLAKYVIKACEREHNRITGLLDIKSKKKIDVVLYNQLSEINQTNLGSSANLNDNNGSFSLPEDKMVLYFNGNHEHLDDQIRLALARIFIQGRHRYFQREVVGNTADWHEEGLIRYIAYGWNTNFENQLRTGMLEGRYQRLDKLSQDDAAFVGQSLWHYLEEVYGQEVVKNLLYLSRINRSLDNAFVFALSTNVEATLGLWYAYYMDRFQRESKRYNRPEGDAVTPKFRKDRSYYNFRLHPEHTHIAYASNRQGRQIVHIYSLAKKKNKKWIRNGFRTNSLFTDNGNPLLAWSPTGDRLAAFIEKRGKTELRIFTLKTSKTQRFPVRKFQKVIDFSWMPDGKSFVLSAMNRGEVNLYTYKLASTTTTPLTQDFYDDLSPQFVKVNETEGILFLSNRPDTKNTEEHFTNQEFNATHFDLYFIDLLHDNSLYRVTRSPDALKHSPASFDSDHYQFVSAENGISNRYLGYFIEVFDHFDILYTVKYKATNEIDSLLLREDVVLDSVIDRENVVVLAKEQRPVYRIEGEHFPVTRNLFSLQEQCVAGNKVLEVYHLKGKPRLFIKPLLLDSLVLDSTDYIGKQINRKKLSPPKPSTRTKQEPQQTILPNSNPDSNWFQSEFLRGNRLLVTDSSFVLTPQLVSPADEKNYSFTFGKVRPYFVRFSVEDVSANLFDNQLLMTRYQPFDPYNPGFYNNNVKANFQLSMTDLLGNHKLTGGLRMPWNFNFRNLDWYLSYSYLEKRLDHKFTFFYGSQYGKSDTRVPFTNIQLPPGYIMDYMIKTTQLEWEMKYAIDVWQSVRGGISWRNDRAKLISQDEFTLKSRYLPENWIFLRLSYVFDNTIPVMENIRQGTQFTFWGEFHKRFPTKEKTIGDRIDFSYPGWDNTWFSVFGFDLRHHQQVYRQITWSSRLSWGSSVGNSRLIYYLGGLDNWFSTGATFDNTTPINFQSDYAYQTVATPLRGFLQNIRNGNSYILFNTELRIPIFTAFRPIPPKIEFLRNFTLVGFLDAGTAWEGMNPFSDSNPLFNELYPNPADAPIPSTVLRIKKYRNPLVFGLGPGIRSTLFGFFLRADLAWGWDSGEWSKSPRLYFSMIKDF